MNLFGKELFIRYAVRFANVCQFVCAVLSILFLGVGCCG